MCDGLSAPYIVTQNRKGLSYEQILTQKAKNPLRTELAYVDVSYRLGRALNNAKRLVEKLNSEEALKLRWRNDALVLVNRWPMRTSDMDVNLNVLFKY